MKREENTSGEKASDDLEATVFTQIEDLPKLAVHTFPLCEVVHIGTDTARPTDSGYFRSRGCVSFPRSRHRDR